MRKVILLALLLTGCGERPCHKENHEFAISPDGVVCDSIRRSQCGMHLEECANGREWHCIGDVRVYDKGCSK